MDVAFSAVDDDLRAWISGCSGVRAVQCDSGQCVADMAAAEIEHVLKTVSSSNTFEIEIRCICMAESFLLAALKFEVNNLLRELQFYLELANKQCR